MTIIPGGGIAGPSNLIGLEKREPSTFYTRLYFEPDFLKNFVWHLKKIWNSNNNKTYS
jgi:hypothetical protein